jgi:protein disulfide-isomerase A6
VLTDSDFDSLVLDNNDLWFVEFYAPWCGHCKNLKPEWAKAATALKGSVKLAKVDATAETELASRYGVKSYPTIRIFAPHNKDQPEEYNGPRDGPGIIKYANSKMEEYGINPTIAQIISPDTFNEHCKDTGSVCIISFLPHIFDSTAAQRNEYLDTIAAVVKKQRGKPMQFSWA